MTAKLRTGITPDDFLRRSQGTLPGWFGVRVTAIAPGRLDAELDIRQEMLAPNGYLHAAAVVALADTTAGYATIAHLPEGAENFTTVELKTNFCATQIEGRLFAFATAEHAGRLTQVWDVEIVGEDDRRLALFRCTQVILWPRGEKK